MDTNFLKKNLAKHAEICYSFKFHSNIKTGDRHLKYSRTLEI